MKMGSYELLDQIGQGGMGLVYRGRHVDTGEIVAVKVMTAESLAEPVLHKRFAQECTAAGRLRHPHIVRGLDFGFEGDRPYLVMEYVEGQSLGERVRQKGPLSQTEGVRMGRQIASALHAAHLEKLIHRDVKPDNILLTKSGQAKLTDLGLIKDLDAAGTVLTKPNAALGTIMFTPPEQFENAQQADALCDVYSLAATLYYALTGVAPFQAHGNLTLLRKKLQNDFAPPSRFVASLPDWLDRAICSGLDAVPVCRPASCQVFADLLANGSVEKERQPDKPAEATGADRRRAIRYPSSRTVSFRVVTGEKSRWRAEVNDISLTGICLQLPRRCEQHSLLSVKLNEEQEDLSITLLVRVNWVRKGPGGTWNVGGTFGRNLNENELTTLLGNVAPTVMVQPG